MSDPVVLTSLDAEGVLTLTMNRPSRRNAFNSEAFLALGHAFSEANTDPRVAVVLLTGAGDDFSSGLDLSAMDMNREGEPPFERMMDAICAFEKPLVCAAKGCAIGFGATVLFHADAVYLGQSAKLRFPFASLGLVTEAAAAYLGPATIGHKKVAELLFTAVDGTVESLQNDFVFRDDVPRTVSAHVDGIMEALVKIYGAHRVAGELTGGSQTD